jgi:RNA polymerase sigma-70 factor (ECF subfamily)
VGQLEDNATQTQALLNLAAEGNEEALDRLITRASERLLKLTRRMLRTYPQLRRWEQTDDVFQNAVIRLHRSLKKVKPDSARNLFGLAALEIRRTLIDLCRHHFGPEGAAGRYQSDIQGRSDDGNDGVLQHEPDRQEDAESLATWSRFHEAVESLPEDEREVTHLVWYGGLTQAEVASVLGISVPTVKRRWYRARLQLHNSMEGQMPPIEEFD